VTCVSASECWAVGYGWGSNFHSQTLIERWDGTSWTIVASPSTSTAQDNQLLSVTCGSGSECWAVGFYINGFTYQSLIERWDGHSWAIVSAPNTSAAQNNFLKGVACASASNCWAVGYYVGASAGQTLIEQWDGNSWTIVSSPNTSTTQDNLLYGVTCSSASECWGVGNSINSTTGFSQTLIERWTGTSWSILPSPNALVPGEASFLTNVTCASTSDCWAVGYSGFSIPGNPGVFTSEPLIERWNGTSWAVVPSLNTNAAVFNFLYGVTCQSASDCWAVGYGTSQTLIEHWDGSASAWVSVSSPNKSYVQFNFLEGVTCLSTSDCWAVGFYLADWNAPISANPANHTLIEHWDGTSWTVVPSPNSAPPEDNFIVSISCASPSECFAVGAYAARYYTGSTPNNLIYQTLILRWDGTSWTIASSPNTSPAQNNYLFSTACAAVSDCWAIGFYVNDNGINQTLIEHWDGSSWAIVPSPNSDPTHDNFLGGAACASASECWAVGYYGGGQTLIERWDGTSWAIAASPNRIGSSNILNAVTCASASDCWTVGYYAIGLSAYTLTEHWDGNSWAIVASPDSATPINVFLGITCASASECWAVGNSYTSAFGVIIGRQTLIERWNGTSWAIAASPNTDPTQDNALYGVTCPSASDCWATGWFGIGQTLVLKYTAPALPTRIVSRKTHGAAGDFDIDLPLTGNTGIECRSGGANGDFTIVFTFANTLSSVGGANVTSGTGSVGSSAIGSDPHNYIVNLTGVTNAEYITITLSNVADSVGGFSSAVSASMGVLLGDVNASHRVDAADVSSVRQQTLQPLTGSNFRNDVNASGRIDAADVSIARQQTLTSLP
jgi:hypothetical protein